jgi:hypothetical protein
MRAQKTARARLTVCLRARIVPHYWRDASFLYNRSARVSVYRPADGWTAHRFPYLPSRRSQIRNSTAELLLFHFLPSASCSTYCLSPSNAILFGWTSTAITLSCHRYLSLHYQLLLLSVSLYARWFAHRFHCFLTIDKVAFLLIATC